MIYHNLEWHFLILYFQAFGNWPAQKAECQFASWWLWILFWDKLTHGLGINRELNLNQTAPGTTKWVPLPGQLQLVFKSCAEWWLYGDKSESDKMIKIRARKPKSSVIFPAFLKFDVTWALSYWRRNQYLKPDAMKRNFTHNAFKTRCSGGLRRLLVEVWRIG